MSISQDSGNSWTDVEGQVSLASDEKAARQEELGRYWDEKYSSEDMRFMLRDRKALPLRYAGIKKSVYKTKNVLPDWIAKTSQWKATTVTSEQQDVAHIFVIPVADRTLEQTSQLVHFLMSVWKTAEQMGLKKCTQMLNVFKFVHFDPGEAIITEGDEGFTFFIVISGLTQVHKDGIGVVAKLGAGKSFGELAIVKGDVRTASIIAETRVECLSLHKSDYDHFLKDIQATEKRENFYLLRDCLMFDGWPRAKIDKLSSTCQRKTVEEGTYIFKQDAETDCVYVIMDGGVDIVKEVIIESRNAWPMAMNRWETSVKRVVKPVRMASLGKGEQFGEISIMRSRPRGASAIATSKTVLVCIEKLEFLHMVKAVGAMSSQMDKGKVDMLNRYPKDEQILGLVGTITGGPGSFVRSGNVTIYPNKTKEAIKREEEAARLKNMTLKTLKEEAAAFEESVASLPTVGTFNTANTGQASNNKTGNKPKTKMEAMEQTRMQMMREQGAADLRRQEEAQFAVMQRSKALGEDLLEHAKAVGNTAELQAKREMEQAHLILVECTQHRAIDDAPLKHVPKKDLGKGWGFDTHKQRRQVLYTLPSTSVELEKGWR
jgi:CRP-like cAMP-binding protein